MVFRNICVLVLWTKVASALEGLSCKHEWVNLAWPWLVTVEGKLLERNTTGERRKTNRPHYSKQKLFLFLVEIGTTVFLHLSSLTICQYGIEAYFLVVRRYIYMKSILGNVH